MLKPQTYATAYVRLAFLNRQMVWLSLFLIILVWSLNQAGVFSKALVNPGGWTLAERFIRASLRPEISRDFLWLTVEATLTTLAFAVTSTILSIIIGFVGGILASRIWWDTVFPASQHPYWRWQGQAIWFLVRGLAAFFRAIHEIIWGLFFVNIIGLDPLTAILAIALPFGAVVTKVFSEILDETSPQSLRALQNSGVSPLKAFTYTLLPQAFPDLLAYSFYRFECAIRAAAVLGIIGAGGLGYQIFLSLQTLKYEQIWTLFIALFLLNGLTDFWSGLLRRKLSSQISSNVDIASAIAERNHIPQAKTPDKGDLTIKGALWFGVFLTVFSFWYVDADFGRLISPRTLEHLVFIGQSVWPPEFNALPLSEWLRLTVVTVTMSVLAVAGAGLFGLPFSFLAASNLLLPGELLDTHTTRLSSKIIGPMLLVLSRLTLLISRSIPPPIWALIFLFVLFPGTLPGAVALGVYTFGVLGRLMAEVVENLDTRPLRALKSQGANGGQLFIYGIIPAIMARYIGYLLYRWEETIRATVVIGLVGAGGLGGVLTDQIAAFYYPGVLATLLIFVILTVTVDFISAIARRDFRA